MSNTFLNGLVAIPGCHQRRSWWAAVFLLLCAIELFLACVIAESVFHDARLTFPERLSALSKDIVYLAFLLFCGFLSASVLRFSGLRNSVLGKTLSGGSLFLFLLLWLSSWGCYLATGTFINREALEFWLPHPVQVFHWVPAHLLFGLPLVCIILLTVLLIALPRLASWRTFSIPLKYLSSLLFITSLLLAFLASPGSARRVKRVPDTLEYSDYYEGENVSIKKLYLRSLRENSGAFVAAASTVWGARNGEKTFETSPEIEIVRKPQIAMRDYLSGIDREKIKRRNVIVILIESLREDQLAVYGGQPEIMPHVNALAAESIVFKQSYTQASHSNYADLSPLSSLYPLRSRQTHVYPKDPSYPRVLIYDVLKPLGWRTAIISSQNDYWGMMINFLDTGNLDLYHHAENAGDETQTALTDTGFARWVNRTKHAGSVDDRFTVEKAIDWIAEEQKEFFIYMNLQTSHFPYLTPDTFERPFGPDKVDFGLSFNDFPREKAPVVKRLYQDSLNYIDLQLGRLFNFLKESGRWQDTIVVVTGDTGQAFYEHDHACHANSLFNEVMRVPLVIKGGSPLVSGVLAEHVDVPPTIFSLLNIPSHPSFQGKNLLAADPPKAPSAFLTVQTPLAHQYAIVKEGFKLIYDVRKDAYSLYNLSIDPQELKVVNKSYPEVVSLLKRRLDTWVAVQLEYYRNSLRQQREYPPVLGGLS